ncbi:hypothetical protein FJZ41_01295 [Candidatus Shapirobacteria bacterium]|nr:hypothetical protein [Candidatus Shapirobacteria bacterium]
MAEEQQEKSAAKTQNPLVVFLIFLIVIGLLALAFFFGLKYRPTGPEATPTPTPTPEPTMMIEATPTPEAQAVTPTVKVTPTVTPKPTATATPTTISQADLYISEYSFNHPPKQGEAFTVKIGLYNKGNAKANGFWWEWWPTKYASACRERIDEGIVAHGGRIVTCTYTYGGWANYETKAVVDADNEINESDETNNTYTQNIVPIH